MFPRGIWEQVGGFDERFWPVWFEDVDFCAKLKQAGFLVHYNPCAVAKHTGGHAVGVLALENRERYWYGSLLEYAAKYFRPLAFRSVCLAVILGAAFRAARGLPRNGLKTFVVYGAVCRLALKRIFRFRRGSGITVV
jgi:GT2 family glycosyltransferase